MSSMIDIVFLLLIYFIVTQKDEISEAHLAVNLPAPGSSQQQSENKPQLLELEVHPGQLLLQGRPLDDGTVFDTLRSFGKSDPDLTVMVKVSVTARANDLVKALDFCQGAKLTKLNVVTLR